MDDKLKRQIDFTQSDTKDVAKELDLVRRLNYPIDKTARVQAINTLKSFAIEWEVKWENIDPTDFPNSCDLFNSIKGAILKKMKKELSVLSRRDVELMEKVLGGGMDFGDAEALEDI